MEIFDWLKMVVVQPGVQRGIQKKKADDLYQNNQPSYECFEKWIPNASDAKPRKRLLARVDSHELWEEKNTETKH